jgi:hypothetical protein
VVADADPASALDAPFRYQPCYCEENAYWLCQHPALGTGERWVAVISNDNRAVPFWGQKWSEPGEPVFWDYHVVVFQRASSGMRVFDPDGLAPMPVRFRDWLESSWPAIDGVHRSMWPVFRLVTAADYIEHLSSDRTHMLDAKGRFVHPPPPWPAPVGRGGPSNLMRFVDMTADFVGEVLQWEDLIERFAQ